MEVSKRGIIISITVLLCLFVVAGGSFFGYQHIKISRYNTLGDEAINSGKWRMAEFWYRKVIEKDHKNLHALTRLSYYTSFYGGSDPVFWWRERIEVEPNSNVAKFGLAKTLLKKGEIEEVEKILKQLHPLPEEVATYNNLLTATYIAKKDYTGAETSSRKALLSSPESAPLKLNLLSILLKQDDQNKVDEINTLLAEISSDKENLPDMWRILFGYAMGHQNWQQAIDVGRQLAEHPTARWDEKSGYAKLLMKFKPHELMPYLKSLKTVEPLMLEEVCRNLSRKGMSDKILEWLENLKISGYTENLSFEISYADALAGLSEWAKLETYLSEKNWQNFDYYRNALLSRAYFELDQNLEFRKHWKLATKLSREKLQEELRLATIVEGWTSFHPQWITLVEEMLVHSVHSLWAYQKLQGYYYSESATWELYRISKKARKALPENDDIRNNAIMYSLLLDKELPEQLLAAELLYKKYKQKPIPATTYAFALYKNNLFKEAYQVIQNLDNRHIEIDEIAYYAAVISQAAGFEEIAKDYLKKAEKATLLPEEIACMTGK